MWSKRRWSAVVVMVGLLVAVVPACSSGEPGSASGGPAGSSGAVADRPNVVVVMTDDQTLEEMRVMDTVNSRLARAGVTFSRFSSDFPLCCPARATYLSGQYSHNNGVMDNVPPRGGVRKLNGAETLPVWLQRAGYYTASIGKYLNGWGDNGDISPPPGWDHWFTPIDPSTYHYFGYSVSVDGQRRDYGHDEADYQTDVLGAEVVRTIEEAARGDQPFFVSFTPLAPHLDAGEAAGIEFTTGDTPTAVPAPRHAGRFDDEELPPSPAYNQPDVSASPDFVRDRLMITNPMRRTMRTAYRAELASLLSVDEWVGRILDQLDRSGVADRTVVMFTSDNGLFRGEHRIPNGKVYLYEPATHVPLVVAGPGFPEGTVVDNSAGLVDLASTIVALTGASPGLALDGADLGAVARDPTVNRDRGVLLENQIGGRSHSEGIHTGRYVYLEHSSGDLELYDLALDPDELVNRIADPTYRVIRTQLAQRLGRLRTCAGSSCEGSVASGARTPPAPPDPGPDQAQAPEPPTPPARPAPALSLQQQAVGLAKGLSSALSLPSEAQQCLADAFLRQSNLVSADPQALLQDGEALAQILAVIKGCASADRLADGLSRLLPYFVGEEVPKAERACLATTMAGLGADDLLAVLKVLYDVEAAADPVQRGRAQTLVANCGIDLQVVLGP